MVNITKFTESYIQNFPSIKDTLKKGLINYSSLARKIIKDNNLSSKNFDAVLIACRRYYKKIKGEALKESKIFEILKNSKLEIKNKIFVLVLEKNIFIGNLLDIEKDAKKANETFHIIEGASAITIITSEEFYKKTKSIFKNRIIKEYRNLVEITLKSTKDIETTPGFTAYLYSLFGENNINILETMSCWTDTIFIIEEKDLNRAMELLRF